MGSQAQGPGVNHPLGVELVQQAPQGVWGLKGRRHRGQKSAKQCIRQIRCVQLEKSIIGRARLSDWPSHAWSCALVGTAEVPTWPAAQWRRCFVPLSGKTTPRSGSGENPLRQGRPSSITNPNSKPRRTTSSDRRAASIQGPTDRAFGSTICDSCPAGSWKACGATWGGSQAAYNEAGGGRLCRDMLPGRCPMRGPMSITKLQGVLTRRLRLKQPEFFLRRDGPYINGSIVSESFKGKGDSKPATCNMARSRG